MDHKKDDTQLKSNGDSAVKRLEAWTGLLKVIIWPLLLSLFFIINFKSIVSIIETIPDLLSHSSKVSVGSVNLEIVRQAEQIGNPELGKITKDLSPKAIEELLLTGNSYHVYISSYPEDTAIGVPAGSREQAFIELEKNGLLDFKIPISKFKDYLNSLNLTTFEENNFDGYKVYTLTKKQIMENLPYLKSQEYFLSEKGKDAFRLVIKAIKSNFENK